MQVLLLLLPGSMPHAMSAQAKAGQRRKKGRNSLREPPPMQKCSPSTVKQGTACSRDPGEWQVSGFPLSSSRLQKKCMREACPLGE